MIKYGRFVLALALVLSALGFSASTVQAGSSERYEWTITIPADFSNVCSFTIHVESFYSVSETVFFDNNGVLTKIQRHVNGQDTFSANGKTIVALPYSFNVRLGFDSAGNVIQYDISGIHEKIRLPDGSLFITAGWTDGMLHPGEDFVMIPDKGNQGKVADFCAALAP
jgi:hypothetical protein